MASMHQLRVDLYPTHTQTKPLHTLNMCQLKRRKKSRIAVPHFLPQQKVLSVSSIYVGFSMSSLYILGGQSLTWPIKEERALFTHRFML